MPLSGCQGLILCMYMYQSVCQYNIIYNHLDTIVCLVENVNINGNINIEYLHG